MIGARLLIRFHIWLSGFIRFLFGGVLLLCLQTAYGQTVEICNDGIDNDGNGKIDCADPFCNFAANVEQGCHCFDGIDNDGDGKIDKADPNCAAYYGLSFVGETSNCSITPPASNTPFSLVGPPAVSGQNTSDTQSKVSVGDVDGDGIPDAVITSKWNSTIRVVATANNEPDGSNAGDIKADFKATGQGAKIFSGSGACKPANLLFEHENMIADIDHDGKAEIFGIVSNRQGNPSSPPTCFFLVAFKYKFGGLVPMYNAVQIGTDRPGAFGIADMDGDGKAEIYLRDRIYAAETGKLLATANGNWDKNVNSAPVAVNMTGDNKLELVVGNLIYTIPDLSNRNPATPAALTLFQDMNSLPAAAGQQYFVKLMNDPIEYGVDTHSSTSVADVDGDGFIDVVMTGAVNSNVGRTAVFYWNVHNGTVSKFLTPSSAELGIAPGNDPDYTNYLNGWIWGTGRVNLGDANGDGKVDLSFIAGNQLFCLTTDASGLNLVPLWASPRTINDSRSGVLTVSIYDFDNDGHPEMVYRDSQELVVIDGATGTKKYWSAICQSHTYTEGPVIADVNGDGATDICVPCNRNNHFNIDDPIQQQALGEVRLYFSSGNAWLPTRKVWNQPGYFVVNIKDNLQLPFPQVDQNLVFSNSPCPNGVPGPQRPLNVFLNQVPNLNANGCPVFPAPDLSFVGDDPDLVDPNNPPPNYFPAVTVTPPICGNLDIKVSFNIINDGDLPITSNIPVSFFNGDPTDPSISPDSLLFTSSVNLVNVQVGDTVTTAPLTFNGPGTSFRLYIVLNNDGSVLPIDPNKASTNECRIDNNIYSVFVSPDPFTTTIEKVQDNFKCSNSAPDNGELKAHIFKGSTEVVDYSDYMFQWYAGIGTTTPIAAGSGGNNSDISGLAEGDYTLVVTNTRKGCTSVPIDTTILRQGNDPDVSVNVISHQTQCSPPNGELQAVIAGGSTGYTFEWFDIALNPLGITGPTATGLTAGNYVVQVSKDGCVKTSPPVTVNGPQVPDAQAQVLQNVVDCSNANSGSITADALFNGVVQNPANYTFDWYFYDNATSTRGSILPPANGSGQTRTGLAKGYYQVVITDVTTKCTSVQAPIVQVQDQTQTPVASITEVSPQTSCDPTKPNGVLAGDALIGGVTQNPSNFTFEWFEGDNTLPANLHTDVSDVNGREADKVKGGGLYYTLRVTTAQHCAATAKYIITENVNQPVVSLAVSPNGICDPVFAGTPYSGQVTANVTFAGNPVSDFSNYQFVWHQGSLITDPTIAVSDDKNPVLPQLNGGDYTVTVERQDLFCTSAPVTGAVLNTPVLPTIVTAPTPSTNCSGGAPNGAIDAQVDLGGSTTTTGYTFHWYNGNATTDPLITSTHGVSSIQGGKNYTIETINNSTGCSNSSTVVLADNSAVPVLTLAANPNTVCDPTLTSPAINFNGSVAASATYNGNPVGSFAGYTFTWHNGNLVTDPVNASSTSQNLANLNGGFYTVTAKINALNCISDPVTAQVTESTVLPAITASTTPSSNCDPLLANGKALVTDVDGVGTGPPYTFKWYSGNLVNPGSEINTTSTATGLQGGVGKNFTVLVTNQNSGCQESQTVQVADNRVLPTLSLTPTPNSICDPSLTSPAVDFNGQVNAAITNQIGALTDYTFTWHDGGTDTDPVDGSSTTGTLGKLNGGQYTATVLHAPTGCVSDPYTAQVLNNQTLPTITSSVVASTNCDPLLANGEAHVTDVSGAGTGPPFTFKWYSGNVPNPGSELSITADLTNQQGGAGQNYTVLVTNQTSGCQNTNTAQIPDAKSVPSITASGSDNDKCVAPDDGTGFLTSLSYGGSPVAAPYNGYTFNWSNGATSTTVNALAAGTYTLTATKTDVGCVSSPASVVVKDNLVYPTISVTSTPQTSCDIAAPNGQLAATVGGITAGYTFIWHNGADDTGAVVPSASGSATSLPGNQNYTVGVTFDATGCYNTKATFLQELITVPAATLNLLSDFTKCVPPNGKISATVNPVPSGTYTYYWLLEQPLTTTNDPAVVIADVTGSPASPNRLATGPIGGVSDTNDQLIPGNYTLVVKDDKTTCVSQPVTKTVQDKTAANITFTIDAQPSSCATNDGQLSVSAVRVDATPTAFQFDWYRGGPTNPTSPITFFGNPANPPQFDPTENPGGISFASGSPVPNLKSDLFTVITTDDFGCQNYNTVFLPFLDAHDIDAVINNSTICPHTSGNGSISVATIPPPSNPGANQTQFSYTFYSGGVADPAKELPDFPFNYVPVSTEVCDNGVDDDGDGLIDAADPDCSSRVNTDYLNPASLAPGLYTIQIQENISGNSCKVYKVVEVKPDAVAPVVGLASAIKANTACNVAASADGSAQISIDKDAADNSTGFNYNIDVNPAPLGWAGTVTTGPYPPGGLPQLFTVNGLSPDNVVPQYTIRVTSDLSGCYTERYISVPNQPVVADLVAGDISQLDAEYCTAALENTAKVEVTTLDLVGGGSDDLGDYRFDWYKDAGLTSNVYSAMGDNTAAPGGEVFQNNVNGIAAGTVTIGSYWVVATKVNAGATGGVGCFSAPFKVQVNDKTVNPQMTLTPASNTACDANFEGSIQVDVSTPAVYGPPYASPGTGATYFYDWNTAAPADSPGNSGTANVFNSLQDGSYTLIATNEATGCTVTGSTDIIKTATPIVVASATHNDQFICSNPKDGDITVQQVTVNGVADPNHNNFVFSWYEADPNAAAVLSAAGTDVLNNVNYAAIKAGSYYVKAERLPGLVPGSGCESAPFRVDIQDKSVNPTFVLSPFSNTSCDANFEGSLKLTVTGPGSKPTPDYSYTWDGGNPVVIPPSALNNGDGDGSDGDDDNPAALQDGLYKVTIKNNVTGCLATGSANILKSETPIVVTNASHTDQQLCTPDGSATVVNVSVGGVVDANHNNFTFNWYANDPSTVPVVTGAGTDVLNIGNYPSIGSGAYYVKAQRMSGIQPGSGCESAPVKLTIKDTHVNPNISFATLASTSCDNNFDGQITVTGSTSSGPGAGANYDFNWPSVPAGSSVANAANIPGPYTTAPPDVVGPGTYTVQLVNVVTQCAASAFTSVKNMPQPLEVLTVNKTDQDVCMPDGSITVSALSPGNTTDYTYNWYLSSISTAPLEDGTSTVITASSISNANYPTMGAGTFFVVATKNATNAPGSGCATPPFRVNIQDISVKPTVALTNFANSSCSTTYNGGIQVKVSDASGPGVGSLYTYTWDAGNPTAIVMTNNNNGNADGSDGDGDAPTGLEQGTYNVTVTNNTTACVRSSSTNISLDLSKSLPNIINVDKLDPTNCIGDGSADVTSISIGGGPAITGATLATDFSYEWYHDDFTPPDQLATTTPQIANLTPRPYFVLVRDLSTDCKSNPTEVDINDKNIVYPDVKIAQTALQISCVSTTGTAALAATGDGNSDSDPNYTFSWYNTLDLSGTLYANTSTISDLQDGNYSVEVTNSVTGCSASALFIVPDNAPIFKPQVVMGGQPRTLCVGQDGAVLARVVNFSPVPTGYNFPLNFTADLYIGANPNLSGPPDVPNMSKVTGFPMNFTEGNLIEGTYTVRVVDNNTGCTATATGMVEDDRTPPTVEVVEQNPLINCDPANPNGQLAATADSGKVGGYGFQWYSGTTVTNPASPIQTSNLLIGVTKGNYVVRATNDITGCFADATGAVTDGRLFPPAPTPKVIADRTSCIMPNGWAAASVGGQTLNYTFDWYNGSTTTASPNFTGSNYNDLDIGPYAVTATDVTTGCVSKPATVNIKDLRKTPELAFESTPSYCASTGRDPVGSVLLTLTNSDSVVLTDIEWSDAASNAPMGNGPQVFGLGPGFYQADVTSSEGCTANGQVEVKTQILSYDLVSQNGDGNNDFWIIDCIEMFPNNNVKIFNRAGVKVYEANHYDNQDVKFDGDGKNGFYPLGTQLPDGTYFYIIDKRDGSKPVTGFFELVR